MPSPLAPWSVRHLQCRCFLQRFSQLFSFLPSACSIPPTEIVQQPDEGLVKSENQSGLEPTKFYCHLDQSGVQKKRNVADTLATKSCHAALSSSCFGTSSFFFCSCSISAFRKLPTFTMHKSCLRNFNTVERYRNHKGQQFQVGVVWFHDKTCGFSGVGG